MVQVWMTKGQCLRKDAESPDPQVVNDDQVCIAPEYTDIT